MCVSRRRPPSCLWPDGSPKFVTIVLSVHQIVAPGIVEITCSRKQTKPSLSKINKSTFKMKLFFIKRFFLAHFHGFVVWSVHVSKSCHPRIDRTLSVRRICRASVPTSPRNLESFSVHQIVDPGIVEITLFQKANQTQPLHNSTLKMKPFFSISYQNVFLAHFRGFVAFVALWFGLSKFQNLTVHVLIVRCQDE